VVPPTATVTFLFTDIEGSTRLWQQDEQVMGLAVARHDKLLREVVEAHGGEVFSTAGDGLAAVFVSARAAVAAALAGQQALAAEPWATVAPVRVRMGLHTGEAERRDGDYFGTSVNRCARLMAVGHGGQVLCSQATAALLDAEVSLIDLGDHRLRDLDSPVHVFQVGSERFAPLRSLDAFPGNLPLQVSSFIGREREQQRVGAALSESRVVTLAGAGGVGKTGLALKLAADLVPLFAQGTWLVELAAVRDPGAVVGAVAAVFGVSARAGSSLEASLVEFLRSKRLLLIVDNCEHVLEPVADLVNVLVQRCPNVTVLATSQEGLDVDGERILLVGSLGAPPRDADPETVAAADAVRLFVDRARQVDADFDLTPANGPAVAEVCRRLDGVPLALELAAARVASMTPAELAAGLDRRFEIFAGGRRRAVKRHQTLRAAVDWSYELCTEAEQRLLARLAVFAGGCARADVEAICGPAPLEPGRVTAVLTGLVAKSLVVADRGEAHTRYRLLETIREYGEERLGEHGETAEQRARHANHFADSLERFDCGVITPSAEAREWLVSERANLERAMGHALDTSDVDVAFRLLCGMPARVIGISSLPAAPVLAMAGADDHRSYPLGLALAAEQAALRGDLDSATQLSGRALAEERHRNSQPDWRVDFVAAGAEQLVRMAIGAWREAAEGDRRLAGVARDAGLLRQAAQSLGGAASYYAYAGDSEAALNAAVEGLALAREVDDGPLIAFALAAFANAVATTEPARARALLDESLHAAGNVYGDPMMLTQAVLVAARLDAPHLALELASRALPRFVWSGERPQLAGVLTVVAWAIADAEPETAAVLQSAARAVASALVATRSSTGMAAAGSTQSTPGPAGVITDLRRDTTRRLRTHLNEERVAELWAEGERVDADRAVVLAETAVANCLTGAARRPDL